MKIKEKEHDVSNWSCSILWINLVLSILIVFLHVNFKSKDFKYSILKQYINVIADCAVPAFFCISAYLTFRKYELHKYKVLVMKRTKSLILPYIVWNIIGYVYQSMNEHLIAKEQISVLSFKQVFISAYNEPLWFIRTLYIFILISPIIFLIVRNKRVTTVIILISIFWNLSVPIKYTSIFFWLPIYLIGAYSGINCRKNIERTHTYSKYKQLCLCGGGMQS